MARQQRSRSRHASDKTNKLPSGAGKLRGLNDEAPMEACHVCAARVSETPHDLKKQQQQQQQLSDSNFLGHEHFRKQQVPRRASAIEKPAIMIGTRPALPRSSPSIRINRFVLLPLLIVYLTFATTSILHNANQGQTRPFAQAQQVASVTAASAKPALILILPQSFKVPTNPLRAENNADASRLQQFVAVINNAQNELEDQQIRQNYPKLSLQIRDAKPHQAGQLFFERVFDYFPPNTRNHLLIPVNLEQVSPFAATASEITSGSSRSVGGNHSKQLKTNYAGSTYSNKLSSSYNLDRTDLFKQLGSNAGFQAQQLIVSIRPVNLETNLGSETEELVSSAPILIEWVPSSDGQRTFSIVQTDKPAYKPSEHVRIRALVINENLRPILNEDIRIQIKNPHKQIVEEIRFPRPTNNHDNNNNNEPSGSATLNPKDSNKDPPVFLDHVFEFPPEPMLGTWTVQLLHNDPVANDTTSFDVKEYVLPPFEVLLETPKYILPNTTSISGAAIAKYHYGKPVQGKVQFKFGYKEPLSKTKFIARTNIKSIDPNTGRVEFKISSDRFRDQAWFPLIAGSHLVVEATVTEMTTGHREIVQDTSSTFIKTPYRISFDEAIDDFKPGLTQQVKVQLVELLSGRPGPSGVRIVAEYRDQNNLRIDAPSMAAENRPVDFRNRLDTEAYSNERGEAVFNIGPLQEDITTLHIAMHAPNSSTDGSPAAAENSSNYANVAKQQRNKATLRNDLALGQFVLTKHESQNGWISVMNKSQTRVRVGDTFVSDILIRDAVVIAHKIFYVITNKGHIVSMHNLDSNGFINFQVTEAMAPSIRLVLFALTHDSIGLLSDSMRLNVERELDCGLKLEYSSKATGSQISATHFVRPNDVGQLQISARPGDVVSLIGVDNAVFSVNNRSRLESSRIIERVKRLDPGCGFGGGRNNLDVFHNAGLILSRDVASSGAQSAPPIGTSCFSFAHHFKYVEDSLMGYSKPMLAFYGGSKPNSKETSTHSASGALHRSKREVDAEMLISEYQDALLRACCRLGTLEDEPQARSCALRKRIVERYIRDTGKCSGAYFDCCRRIFEPNSTLKLTEMIPNPGELQITARNEHPLGHSPPRATASVGQLDQIEAQTLVRRDFRETWLFEVVDVGATSGGKTTLDVQVPHSITSWSISAIALNRELPICVAPEPLLVRSFQEVFIHVAMPYKVVQGEQIDLVATLYNYSPEPQELLVYMYGVEDVCSEAEPGERSELRRMSLDKHASQAMIFTMIPLRIGTYPIKLVAITTSSNTSDILERQLVVVPRGRPVIDETTFSLDPMNQQRRSKRAIQTGNLVDEIDSQRGLQRSRIRLTPSRESEYIVPQTQECIVSAVGDKMGQTVQTSLLDVENLIRLPHGCGEQVMIYLGPTLYTARYLNSIGKLTGDLRWRANRYIQSGYKRVLGFRNDNGGFSAFAGRKPSVWLTAFIAKMLCQTEKTPFVADEVHVDKTVIRLALSWLVDRQHAKTGTWIEWNPVYHREMLGGVLKENGLTAFVTITLNECAHHAPEVVDEIQINPPPGDKRDGQTAPGSNHADDETNGFAKLRLATQRAEDGLILDRFKALKEKNPYVLAMVAYALSASRPREATSILADLWTLSERSLAKNQLFWRGDHQIETAAYALQTLVELAPLLTSPDSPLSDPKVQNGANFKAARLMAGADALAIANWLTSRRSYTGAFDSTQDTVVALEALSKFAQLQPTANGHALMPQASSSSSSVPSLFCNVTINNRTRRSIEFGKENSLVMQTFKLDSLDLDPAGGGETLDITTSGNGLGIMSVKLKYNVFQDEDDLCRFSIDSSIEEWRPKLSLPASETMAGESGAPMKMAQTGADSPAANGDEDDFFKTFDKSMLNELNLIDLNQNEPVIVQQLKPRTTRDKQQQPPPAQVRHLRLRRFAPLPVARNASDAEAESWASKMVASIRNRFQPWLSPSKQTTQTTTTTTTRSLAPYADETINGPEMATTTHLPETAASQRGNANNQHRRSAQGASVPLLSTNSGIPADAHLNTLSKQLEITSQNTSQANSTQQQKQQQQEQQIVMVESPSKRLVLLLRVCAHHLSSTRDSEMAVIEIGVLSGFKPNEADLKEILNDPGTPAMKYELSSDRSMVMLYLSHIPNSGPFCFQFRLVRDSLVYNLQSGYIRVYEYYSPAHSCSNFYTPTRISNLMETKCDASGEVCQCAAKSLCPATSKLIGLSAAHETNSTSAREQLLNLVCKGKYDLVSLVKLKSVRFHEPARALKLFVKVTSDLRGNLTKLVEAQRQQKAQLADQVRKPHHNLVNLIATSAQSALATGSLEAAAANERHENASLNAAEETSLDQLQLTIDVGCLRDDPLLLHMSHPNQQRHSGEQMILFARSDRLERRYFRATQKTSPTFGAAGNTRARVPASTATGPRPKANILGLTTGSEPAEPVELGLTPFEDAQNLQYSLTLALDRDSILHDVSYQAKVSHREAINSLVLWLELRARREKWACPEH